MTTDDLDFQVNSLYEQHLKTRLRNARRNLANTVEQFTRTPDNPQLNDRVDEASREVALIERELTVYRAQSRERQQQTATPPADSARVGSGPTPNEAFRAAQLAKATQAIRGGGVTPSAGASSDASAATGALPEVVAKPATPAVPPQTASPAPPGKTCPQCGSHAPIQAQRCKCGYSFSSDPGFSADGFLTREEVLALRRGSKNQPS